MAVKFTIMPLVGNDFIQLPVKLKWSKESTYLITAVTMYHTETYTNVFSVCRLDSKDRPTNIEHHSITEHDIVLTELTDLLLSLQTTGLAL